jgi:hypothetical protein
METLCVIMCCWNTLKFLKDLYIRIADFVCQKFQSYNNATNKMHNFVSKLNNEKPHLANLQPCQINSLVKSQNYYAITKATFRP